MLEALAVRWGYWAIGLGTFLEGESVLIAGGALAHRGLLSLPLVMLAAFLGSVTGDQVWFHLGRRFGQPLLERRPAWKARVAGVQNRLDRYGSAFVFGFRFIYGVRTVTPALLGLSGYAPSRFVFLNVAGAAVWVVVVGGAGWALGAALTALLQRAVHVEELLAATGLAMFIGWCIWRHIQRRVTTDSTPSSPLE